jgi:hypothetical protein
MGRYGMSRQVDGQYGHFDIKLINSIRQHSLLLCIFHAPRGAILFT